MAETYTYAGWKIFPCWWVDQGHCACQQGTACKSPGKHPIFSPAHPAGSTCRGECDRVGHGLYDATGDADTVNQWWARYPLAHIGLPADTNGLAVLDVDPIHGGTDSLARLNAYLARKGEPLPPTLTQRTGSGGTHYVFAAPEGGIKGGANVFGPNMPGLDTRGRGGYIIVAPSGHASGGTYEWVDFFARIAPWPAILARLMEPGRPPRVEHKGPSKPPSDAYAAAALRRECEAVASQRQPGRNDRLNEASFSLGTLIGSDLLDEYQVRRELYAAALASGLGEAESVKTILSGIGAGKLQPREVRT